MSTITHKRGDTWNLSFEYTDPEGAPIDFTDCSARLQVRDKRSGEVLIEASTTTGELTLSSGLVELVIDADTMAGVKFGSHEFDLEITWADGTVESTDTLTLRVIEDITRDD